MNVMRFIYENLRLQAKEIKISDGKLFHSSTDSSYPKRFPFFGPETREEVKYLRTVSFFDTAKAASVQVRSDRNTHVRSGGRA